MVEKGLQKGYNASKHLLILYDATIGTASVQQLLIKNFESYKIKNNFK